MPLPIHTSSYYNLPELNFRNSLYAMEIALDTKFQTDFFKGETNRIVYSKNSYALRKRIEKKEDNISNLNFPFMNYRTKPDGIKFGTSRPWKNTISALKGIYIEELSRNLRVVPITIDYEGTLWYQRSDDTNYTFQNIMYDNAVETILEYTINVSEQDIRMIAILNYNYEFDPIYDENKWLETNKIHTIGFDFTCETFYIKDADVSIPDKVLFDFAVNNELDEESTSSLITLVNNHYTEETSEV